jgi:hypothetical protein
MGSDTLLFQVPNLLKKARLLASQERVTADCQYQYKEQTVQAM